MRKSMAEIFCILRRSLFWNSKSPIYIYSFSRYIDYDKSIDGTDLFQL